MLPKCCTISALVAHRGSLLFVAASCMLLSRSRPICQPLNTSCSPARISGSNLKVLRAEIAALDKSLAAAEEQRRDLERQAAEKRTQQLKALPEVRLPGVAPQPPPFKIAVQFPTSDLDVLPACCACPLKAVSTGCCRLTGRLLGSAEEGGRGARR